MTLSTDRSASIDKILSGTKTEEIKKIEEKMNQFGLKRGMTKNSLLNKLFCSDYINTSLCDG